MTITKNYHNAHIVLLDNFDSFTYNLVDQFRSLGFPVTIYRNHLSAQQIEHALLEHKNPVLVLSPGPGAPAARTPRRWPRCSGPDRG